MFITEEIARRVEIAEALDGVDCAEACAAVDPDCGGSVQSIAGGFCMFCGAASPLTHALGVGLHGPVTNSDVLELEEFFKSRGAPVIVDVTPYTDPSLREILSGRGYTIGEMSNVLVRAVAPVPDAQVAGVEVRDASPDECDLYCRAVVGGFFSREELTEEEERLGRMLFHAPSSVSLLASVGGEIAGGCGMSTRNRVASFFGDATIARFRGRGVQTALILDRLRRAAEAGCDLATAGTQPGSLSQRNYQRLGFEVAYTKLTMTRCWDLR